MIAFSAARPIVAEHQRKQTFGDGTVACRCGWVRRIRHRGDGIEQFIDHQTSAIAEGFNAAE